MLSHRLCLLLVLFEDWRDLREWHLSTELAHPCLTSSVYEAITVHKTMLITQIKHSNDLFCNQSPETWQSHNQH